MGPDSPIKPASPESLMWTEEETRYLKAIFTWESLASGDDSRRRTLLTPSPAFRLPNNDAPPVDEFRVLVIGGKGVGKTSILTRFSRGRLPRKDETHESFSEQGWQQIIEIEGQNYSIDALEMPSKHLWRDDLVKKAIDITEAAVIVYDIRSHESLQLARGIHDLIRETVGTARDYAIMLAGNGSDVDDESRQVAWSEGNRIASSFVTKTSFLEVSALTGDSIRLLFPLLARDLLKLRMMTQQRREYAEKMLQLKQEAEAAELTQKRKGLWWRISRPFFRREVAQV